MAIIATGLLSGCPLGKAESDGGSGTKDGGSSSDGGSGARDGGTVVRDAGTVVRDAGTSDSSDDLDGGKDAGVVKDAGSAKDAAVDSGAKDGSVDAGPADPAKDGTDAPTLSAVGYYDDDMGLRIMFKGRDPNGDVASYTVKFFNGAAPVAFDIDNDEETPSVNVFTGALSSAPGDAAFFISFEPTRELADAVDTIKVLVSDAGGRSSAEMTIKRGVPTATSSACDPLGFNRCTNGNVCTKAGTGFRCTVLSTARTTACNAALVLDPAVSASIVGHISNPSLWDTPASCSSNDPKFEAEAVVKLRLTSPASKVTLSTVNAGTDFDTALYLLSSCGVQPPACEDQNSACSDDLAATASMPATNRSTLVLRNMPVGDHLIVVDSFPSSGMSGDTFELSALVE